jgi:hypothetical protein
MLNIHNDGSSPNRVTVTFADGALSFMLSEDATFEDLTDRLDRLGEWRHGKPVAIEVKLAAASARTTPTSGHENLSRYVCSAPDHRLYLPTTRPCPIGAAGILSYKLHRYTSGRPHPDSRLPYCRRTGTEDIPHRCQSVRRRYRE